MVYLLADPCADPNLRVVAVATDMKGRNMTDEEQAAQYADERARMEQIDEILQAAKKRPLHADEIDVIVWETGLGQFRKE